VAYSHYVFVYMTELPPWGTLTIECLEQFPYVTCTNCRTGFGNFEPDYKNQDPRQPRVPWSFSLV